MKLSANVFDIWAFSRSNNGVRYLLLYTAQAKADQYFNGGRFWQIPSGFVQDDEDVIGAIERRLNDFGLPPAAAWAAEHAYTIYNRRFNSMQIIGRAYASNSARIPEFMIWVLVVISSSCAHAVSGG